MDYRELKDGKYLLTVKQGVIRDCLTNEVIFSQGKEYILTVKDGTYSIWDDFHDKEQVSLNFSCLEWFNVKRL